MQPLDVGSDEAWKAFLPGGKLEDDSALIVSFFVDKKLMGAKSEAAGKPVFEDREFVKIMIKGQDKQIVVEEVKESHKRRFPIAYLQFQQAKPLPIIGTPIEMLPGVGPSLAHHFKGLNLRTVEDVAGVTDENTIQNMGSGARALIVRAQAWLAQTNEKSLTLAAQNDELRSQNTDLLATINEFRDRLAELEKKPGDDTKAERPSARKIKKDAKKKAH